MEIAVLFESFEGQTKKIADHVAERILGKGYGVHVLNAADRSNPVSFDGIDRVVLAAPVHERRHPKDFEVLLTASKVTLSKLPTMMLSVSLKASFREGLEEAQEYLTEMKMRTGLSFDREILVPGAVRTDSYGYFESQIVQNVVLDGQRVDLVDGVREFTDWNDLDAQIDAFLANDPEENGQNE